MAINVFYADCYMYQCNASVGDGANDSKYGDNIVPIHNSTAQEGQAEKSWTWKLENLGQFRKIQKVENK